MANETSITGNDPAQPIAYRVLVIDNYHVPDDDAAYSVGPFPTWEQAVEYARRRTWDSVEELREADPYPNSVRSQFYMFGESCSVYGGDGEALPRAGRAGLLRGAPGDERAAQLERAQAARGRRDGRRTLADGPAGRRSEQAWSRRAGRCRLRGKVRVRPPNAKVADRP